MSYISLKSKCSWYQDLICHACTEGHRVHFNAVCKPSVHFCKYVCFHMISTNAYAQIMLCTISTYQGTASERAEHRCLQGECTLKAPVWQLSVYHHAQCNKQNHRKTKHTRLKKVKMQTNKQTNVFQQFYTLSTGLAAVQSIIMRTELKGTYNRQTKHTSRKTMPIVILRG